MPSVDQILFIAHVLYSKMTPLLCLDNAWSNELGGQQRWAESPRFSCSTASAPHGPWRTSEPEQAQAQSRASGVSPVAGVTSRPSGCHCAETPASWPRHASSLPALCGSPTPCQPYRWLVVLSFINISVRSVGTQCQPRFSKINFCTLLQDYEMIQWRDKFIL